MNILKLLQGLFKSHPVKTTDTPNRTDSGNSTVMTMNELIAKIANTTSTLVTELEKYGKEDNKSAARRARKTTLELEKLYKEFRKRSVHELCDKLS